MAEKSAPYAPATALAFRRFFAYHLPMPTERQVGALLIAASIIAVIRLRGEPIKPSPKLTATGREAVELAKLVLCEVENRGSAWLFRCTRTGH
jgi:hypothetical protein